MVSKYRFESAMFQTYCMPLNLLQNYKKFRIKIKQELKKVMKFDKFLIQIFLFIPSDLLYCRTYILLSFMDGVVNAITPGDP